MRVLKQSNHRSKLNWMRQNQRDVQWMKIRKPYG